jgi:hypothetical protein
LRHGKALGRHLFGSAEHLQLVSVPAALTMSLIPTLEADPRVRYAEPNRILTKPAAVPNDPDLGDDADADAADDDDDDDELDVADSAGNSDLGPARRVSRVSSYPRAALSAAGIASARSFASHRRACTHS